MKSVIYMDELNGIVESGQLTTKGKPASPHLVGMYSDVVVADSGFGSMLSLEQELASRSFAL